MFFSGCGRHKDHEVINVVNGIVSIKKQETYCSYERSGGWLSARLNNLCGKEGRFYVEKLAGEGNSSDSNSNSSEPA